MYQQQVEPGIAVLKKGGLAAFPTDTVYGLGAVANIPEAVARIYRVKGRPPGMALPLLLGDIAQLDEIARVVPPAARQLACRFLPGALTLVLLKSAAVSEAVTAGGKTIAVRVPDHPVPLALARGVGAPIVGTSANRSGRPSTLTADDVRAQLGDEVDLVIEGDCYGGRESTVVDLTGGVPVILREGAIPAEELRQVCPDIKLKQGD